MPHGVCYLWKPGLVGLHLFSNTIIALSYFSIPFSLVHIVRQRQDLPFDWIFFLFAAFIISCGIGHSMDIWTLWHPDYWFSGYIRAITAIVSLITAIALVYLIPQILTLLSPAQMEEANQRLVEEINERQKIEEALRKSEQRWQLALQGTGDGLFDWNIISGEAFMSARLKANLGYQEEEIANNYEGWRQLVHPDDVERVEQEIQANLEAKNPQYSCEYRMRCQDDSYKWILARGMALWNENDQPMRMVGSHQDITIRKQAEAEIEKLNQELEERIIKRTAELEKANRLKDDLLICEKQATAQLEKRNQELDQFAYVTSHDLKAPLRAIANLSEWLEEDLEDKLDKDTREQMNLLRGRVHRMENLINGLLHYSRSGRLNVKPETVDVNQLLNEVLEYLSPPPEFTIEREEEMPTLVTKRLPLQQVFLNLISNALKHHHREKGKIAISVQDQGEYYQFAISDDGPGIAPEYHEKVFVIFQTLEARDKNENTGIGLSIVKKTVEAEGGTIELESQLGQGTTFRFSWPKSVGH